MLFDERGFPARWHCGTTWLEEPAWAWLTIGSDITIWAAYMSIPLVLIYFVQRRQDIPFRSVFLLFGAFILACGTTHLIDAIIFWHPIYRFAAVVKLITAVVSGTTVGALLWMRSSILALRSPAQMEFEVWKRTRELEDVTARLRTEMEARRLAETSVRSSEERLKMALRAGRMGTWEWDLHDDTMRLDTIEFDLLNMTQQSAPMPLSAILKGVHPDDAVHIKQALKQAVDRHEDFDEEFRFLRGDGELQWLAARGKVLFDERARPTRVVGVSFDISERKNVEVTLENARRQAQAANEAKSEFLANMSHEIRTPLTSILGCADILTPQLTNPDHREIAQMIRDQGRLLLGLLNDILDVSKIEAGRLDIHLEPTSIRQVVESMEQLMRPQFVERGLELTTHFDSPLPPTVKIDPLRVRQILLNLVGNALKFTEKGGVQIRVKCDRSQDPVQLVLEVHDTGVGIPADRRDAIFEAFTQGHSHLSHRYGGTGLGLTICQRLVGLMQGTIRVRSEVGRGSSFSVSLPIGPAAALLWNDDRDLPNAPQSAHQSSIRSVPARVLIAEDTRGIRFLLARMLEPLVDAVNVAENGALALAEARRAVASGTPYHVILMDVNMPVLNGIDATRQLRDGGYQYPIVALTAGATTGDRDRCFEAGCDDYLAKPIEQESLLEIIGKQYNRAVSMNSTL